jgi:hypothetical protein
LSRNLDFSRITAKNRPGHVSKQLKLRGSSFQLWHVFGYTYPWTLIHLSV